MRFIASLVVLTCAAHQMHCSTEASLSETNLISNSRVRDHLDGLISPVKQTSPFRSIRDFWNSDTAGPIRGKFEEYKERAFERFADAFNKHYKGTELAKRLQIFLDRYNRIESWHSQYELGKVSYDMKLNRMADMTDAELNAMMKLDIPNKYANMSTPLEASQETLGDSKGRKGSSLPAEKTWIDYFTPARDQGDCGSCYAFATVDTVTAQLAIASDKSKPNKDHSVQQVVDCSKLDQACSGGWPFFTLKYIQSIGGLAEESKYPYKAKRGQCLASRYSSSPARRQIRGLEFKQLTSESAFKEHLAQKGPVIAAMHAASSFIFYKDGIFDDSKCGLKLWNHAVVVAGYGSEAGKDYWLIRNSFGPEWGNKGYMKMLRGKKLCRIGSIGWGITKV